ncbi:MAG TPA: glycerol-3-phosphate dehydrogenase/oxidase [Acidimicrobiales bacterium]|nr:glycerol-3-phosphate dehydrogenase/oxidase [Acidimicrobiales bacterium]
MSPTSSFRRSDAIEELGRQTFDVLVVGGGITGAGVALDAAARGLSTALVERADLGSGTSSKSSKLVHGGLRYLQQKEYWLVAESLAERQRLLRNAPHLVSPLPFLIPLFGRAGVVNKTVAKAYSSALWMYDLVGGMRIGRRHRRIDRAEAARLMPTLRNDSLVAGFIYYDARADDARLTLTVARTAALDHGAVVANYAPVATVLHDSAGRAGGARLGPSGLDAGPDTDGIEVRARVVVNATGVWSDQVRQPDGRGGEPSLRPAKGVHITLAWDRLRAEVAAVLPVPGDRRSIFVIPWGNRVYVGTTDTDYEGSLDEPLCTAEDVAYLLRAVNAFVTDKVSESDVLGTWAGLRPLVRQATTERTADLSRRHLVTTAADGVVTVSGGKLTTYRKMAADTVDAVIEVLGDTDQRGRRRRSPTKRLSLHGAVDPEQAARSLAAERPELDRAGAEHLVRRYGTEAGQVAALAGGDLAAPLVPGLPYLGAEALWACRQEMAATLEDVLSRRTRAFLLDAEATVGAASSVAALVAPELGWDDAATTRQLAAFAAMASHERSAAGIG